LLVNITKQRLGTGKALDAFLVRAYTLCIHIHSYTNPYTSIVFIIINNSINCSVIIILLLCLIFFVLFYILLLLLLLLLLLSQ